VVVDHLGPPDLAHLPRGHHFLHTVVQQDEPIEGGIGCAVTPGGAIRRYQLLALDLADSGEPVHDPLGLDQALGLHRGERRDQLLLGGEECGGQQRHGAEPLDEEGADYGVGGRGWLSHGLLLVPNPTITSPRASRPPS
jgi:hypothetical protein